METELENQTLNETTTGQTGALPERPLISADDLYWFNEGTHSRIYEEFGAHPAQDKGVSGTHFAVWAPNAESVSVMGAFNEWRKFANLRLLLAYMLFQPGKKLLFMGDEFGQPNEWYHEASLDWALVQKGNPHNGLQKLMGTLNWLYRNEAALHEQDAIAAGFQWVDCHDAEESTLSWLRFGAKLENMILLVCNFTPVPRHNLRIGVPRGGFWKEMFNSDAADYGGSGQGNFGGAEAAPLPWHHQSHSLALTLPPLAAVACKAA